MYFTGGAKKLATTASGISVTGSVTADGLTVDGASEIRSTLDATLNITSTAFTVNSGDVYGSLNFVTEDGSVASGRKNAATIQAINAGGAGSYCDLDFYTSAGTGATNTKSLKIAANGDISFYEDTGTTPKFFWDASDESLIIGSGVNTYAKLTISEEGTSVGSTIRLIGTNTTAGASQVSHITSYQPAGGFAGAAALDFKVRGGADLFAAPSTVMTLLGGGSGGGKVGIGTDSPSFSGFGTSTSGIDIVNSNNAALRLSGNAADAMFFVSGSGRHWLYGKGAVPMTFSTNSSERLRIDASGQRGYWYGFAC